MRASRLCQRVPDGCSHVCMLKPPCKERAQLRVRYPVSRLAVARLRHPLAPPCSRAVADRGVNSNTDGSGWIVRCDIVGLSTASPSLACCTKVWGTNTTGTSGSDGNNVSWGQVGRPVLTARGPALHRRRTVNRARLPCMESVIVLFDSDRGEAS